MATNLTNVKIKESFQQLLHVDGGPAAAEKVVLSGVGTQTALRVGTGSISVGTVRLNGNTISTTDVDGNLNLTPNGDGSVNISKLAVADPSQARTALGLGSAARDDTGDFATAAQGALADSAVQPGDIGTLAAQDANNVSITGGSVSNVSFTGSFTGITLIESDTFSTVNGNPDGLTITENQITAAGSATNIDIELTPKGTGRVLVPDLRASASLGYTASTYGTVTQETNKSTAVTLNTVTGRITMNDASLSQNSAVTFTLSNSELSGNDVLLVNIAGGGTPGSYNLEVCCNQVGSALLKLRNMTNGSLAEPVEILFAILKVG
jgi:hypothetical protein